MPTTIIRNADGSISFLNMTEQFVDLLLCYAIQGSASEIEAVGDDDATREYENYEHICDALYEN